MIKSKLLLIILVLFSSSSFANIGGSDLQNFNPTTNGLGFVTVHPSATLTSGEFNLGSFLTYATNSLPYSTISTAPNSQTFTEPNDRLLYSSLHIGIGLLPFWDFGVSGGFINAQNIEQSNFLFSYGDTGINEVRLNSKVRVYQEDGMGMALVAGMDFEQIKNNPFSGDNAGPSYNLEAVLDMQMNSDWLWAVNGGYRLRQQGTPIPNTGVTPMSDQWIYSTALSYRTDELGSALFGELFGSYPIEENTTPTDRHLSNLESLIGYRWRGLENIDIHGGVGTEVYHGLGSPDVRAYVGINSRLNSTRSQESPAYEQKQQDSPLIPPSVQPVADDSDNDGVPDPIDQCPNTWAQNYVDDKGCATTKSDETPTGGTGEADIDSDGIVDSLDQCSDTAVGAEVNAYGCEISPYEE